MIIQIGVADNGQPNNVNSKKWLTFGLAVTFLLCLTLLLLELQR